MVVTDLRKDKKDSYIVVIDNKEYIFDEEIIIEYRLVKGKEIDAAILDEISSKNNLSKLYKMALSYSLKYNKNKAQLYDYLASKGANNQEAAYIIEKLSKINAINENKLISSIVLSLVKKGNGRLLIEKKLYEKQFSQELINDALSKIDNEDYIDQLYKVYLKCRNRYDDEELFVRNNKIKKYLLSRGYTYDDINKLDFNND